MGEAAGGWTYQSPSWRRPSGQSRTAPLGATRANVAASPPSTSSAAPCTARVTSPGGTAARVAASRQRLPPGSAATRTLTPTRATSSSVCARKRVSQSGGDASSTIDGCALTWSTMVRASSRGSESATPSNRTSSACHPGSGKREAGRVISVDTTPLSGSRTGRDASRLPVRPTVSNVSRFPLPPSRLPAVP